MRDCSRRCNTWIWAAALACLLPIQQVSAQEASPPDSATERSGRLSLIAAVVGDDLSVKPVPKFRIQVAPATGDQEMAIDVITGFDGKVEVELPPGAYRLTTPTAVTLEGTSFSWELPFELEPGGAVILELSNDNAITEKVTASRITDEAKIFEAAKSAVFLIEADAGHGSGFLVDSSGLIITNYHVAGKARYLAAKLDPRTKYPAERLAVDQAHDVAILRINPGAVASVRPLLLIHEQEGGDEVFPGERVLAIGSPLTTEGIVTTGIVSKVEERAIISDVSINPGNSGGPLLNIEGDVIGINTFGIGDGSGPGVSGIVRIHLAENALNDARKALASSPLPGLRQLAVQPEHKYPPEGLKALLDPDADLDDYHVEAKKIDVHFLTPPLRHSLVKRDEIKAAEQQKKRRKGKGVESHNPTDDFYTWREEAGAYDAVVQIRAMPEIKMTGGSKAALFFGALGGVIPPARYRFKTDFREMQLLRNGEVLEPIIPGRNCTPVSMKGFNTLEDVGCFGFYTYAPAAFSPGATLELHVFTEDKPDKPAVIELREEFVEKIWADFAPWVASLQGAEPAD